MSPDFSSPVLSSLSYGTDGRLLTGNPFIPSAARTTAVNDILGGTNFAARGLLLFLAVSAASGTGGLTMKVNALGPTQSTGGAVIATAAAAVIATGTTSLVVYPSAVAGYTTNINSILPPRWSVTVSVGDASSYTYQVAAYLLP